MLVELQYLANATREEQHQGQFQTTYKYDAQTVSVQWHTVPALAKGTAAFSRAEKYFIFHEFALSWGTRGQQKMLYFLEI